ncbi:unnamed protein product [Caenorhabditis sp. 36 PRJEB53466]|nr:unnamed protein product [Caenorhabditis sp. 36 PRJEB53466]
MSQFDEAFKEFSKNPTPAALECFASQMEVVSKMLPNEVVKSGLVACIREMMSKPKFSEARKNEAMLRLYKIMCRVSTTLGGIGIYKELEKKGDFVNSLKFHLQWAEECAKKNLADQFETVLNLARKRLSDRMDLTSLESGFRDIADDYFSDRVNHLFINPDDTLSMFDTRLYNNGVAKKAKRRSSVCHLRQVAPINNTGKNAFGPRTITNLRSEFIDTPDRDGISIEEFRYAKWRDDFGEDVDKRRDSGIVMPTYKCNETDLKTREAVDSRMNSNPRRRQLSTLSEKTAEEHEDEKRSRIFSPQVPTKDAVRPPLRDSMLKENNPPTITLSSDTKITANDTTFEKDSEPWASEADNEKLLLMASGKKENSRPERTLSTSSQFSTLSSRTAKSGAGLELMAENKCLEAHAMFSDTVHLGYEKTMMVEDDSVIIESEPTKSLAPTQLSNATTDFSVLCDPDPTMHATNDRLKKPSNGLNVVYDELAGDEEVKRPQHEDVLPSKSITTPPSFNNLDEFPVDDDFFGGFAKPLRGSIVTSTPAVGIPYVDVEEYFGNKDEEAAEQQNAPTFVAPSSSTFHRLMRRKSAAPANTLAAPPPSKPVQQAQPTFQKNNSSIEALSENLERRLSLGAEEIQKAIEDEAETTGIRNRRRSEVMRGEMNPWDEEIRKKLMSLVRPPTNMHEFPSRSPKIQANRDFEAGGERFQIQSLIGQGGYAKVYRALNEEGKTIAVKYEVPSCSWEVYICDQMRNRLLKDGKEKMADGCIMQVMDAYVFSTASLLVNEYHEYGTLLEYANHMKDPNWHITCFLITQMARILQDVHGCNIIHGDIKPDNFIITRKIDANWSKDALLSSDTFVFKLIDWGRAIDMRPLTGKTFKGRAGTEGFDSPEMIDGRPWTYQADYFGFAATMAVLVTGKYAKLMGSTVGEYSLNVDIKRRNTLRETILDVTNKFLNISSCATLPDWNEVIRSFSDVWEEKFDVSAWRQAVSRFNESCELAATNNKN